MVQKRLHSYIHAHYVLGINHVLAIQHTRTIRILAYPPSSRLAPPAQASQYQAFCSQFLGTRSSSMASSSSISFLPVMVSTWSTGMHMGVRK